MDNAQLSIQLQCNLLGLNRSSYYARPIGITPDDQKILNRMDEIFTAHPYYGNRRMMHVLRTEGFTIGRKRVRHYYQILGIEAIATYGKPEIFNTDQGVQFTSNNFIQVLQEHGIAISMDGKGRALDNVFIERFWRSLKQEKIYRIDLFSVKEAKDAILEYMEFYNNHRLHQSLG